MKQDSSKERPNISAFACLFIYLCVFVSLHFSIINFGNYIYHF